MQAIGLPVLVYYLAVIAVFCTYGLHRYGQLVTFLRTGGLRRRSPEPRPFSELPSVTVQLPMFNERHVAERVIEAACAVDYPRERLQVQVLDDSTDESAGIARRCCARMVEAGHDVAYLHRNDRTGFKAGALGAGLESATGELVAVFDADFVPPREFLRQTVHHFTDETIGLVQTRWSHLNRGASLLTEIQAICLDGHFVIEQLARARSGRWFNFNGTAGIWRRVCIEDAGGWHHDTLTEDTDLSYRAQLAGWRFRYLPHVICPAELPPTVSALMSQQHRWNKGLVQGAIKLLPTILRSRAPLATKLEAFFHLTSPLPYAAMFLLTLLVAPAFFIDLPSTGIGARAALGLGLLCLLLGTGAASVFYLVSQAAQARSITRTLLCLPALMAVGVGISFMNTRAIIEALIGRQSPFVRTPKYADARHSAPDPAATRSRRLPPGLVEVLMGGLMMTGAGLAFTQPYALVGVPFILLFAAGYFGIGVPLLRSSIQRARRAAQARVALRLEV